MVYIHTIGLCKVATSYLLVSLCKCASYKQNGLSIVVHSFMNSMEPPGSADISQIPSNLWGSPGAPSDIGIHGSCEGVSNDFASGTVNNLEQSGAQYIPLIITEAYGAIYVVIYMCKSWNISVWVSRPQELGSLNFTNFFTFISLI